MTKVCNISNKFAIFKMTFSNRLTRYITFVILFPMKHKMYICLKAKFLPTRQTSPKVVFFYCI